MPDEAPPPQASRSTRIRSALFTCAFYLTTALFLILGSPLLLAPRRTAMVGLRAHARVSNWLLRQIVGTRTRITGLENLPKGPCLIVAKHQSAWETFALIPLLKDPAIVLKQELTEIPVYGWFCRKFAHLIVDRSGGAKALKALVAAAKERSAQGRQILIFAEGTRVAPGAPPAYKPGFTALYSGLDLPCVPVSLNSGLFWPARAHQYYPGTIDVVFGAPIPAGLDRKIFQNRIISAIEATTNQLLEEAAHAPNAPPTAAPALARLKRSKSEYNRNIA